MRTRLAPLTLAALGFCAGLALPAPGSAQDAASPSALRLPSLGEPDASGITEGAERRYGDLIMRQLRRDVSFLDDPLLLAYVQSVWDPLVRAARARGEIAGEIDAAFAWQPFLLRDRSINAFALPGGHIGIHLGLIAESGSPDELAAVLAHELVHITQRHIVRSNASAGRQTPLAIAGLLLGMLAAARTGSPDLAQASIMVSQGVMAQGQLNYSRDLEREADRIGFSVLTDAGFSGAGVAAIFERLGRANRLNDSGNYPYLRSHPLTVERIGEAKDRLQAQAQSPAAASGAPPGRALSPTMLHQLMKARARVLMDPSEPALRRWQALASAAHQDAHEQAAASYSAALASVLLSEPRAAEQHLRALAPGEASAPARMALDLLTAEVRVAQGQAHSALALLESLDGRQRPIALARAEAALQWGRQAATSGQRATAGQAIALHTQALSAWVVERPHDAEAWALLARCHQALGQPLRAIRAQAEYQWARGDLNGALDRFKAGQRLVRTGAATDHVEASIIDARARELQRERRRTYAEMRGVREQDLPPELPPNIPL